MGQAPTISGIDHVGLAVRDIEAATAFLKAALGAEVIYETLKRRSEPQGGPETEQRLNLTPGSEIRAIRMLRVQNGPGIELFEIAAPDQHQPARASDLGWQHIAVYTADMEAALERFTAAGGIVLAPPHELPPLEQGPSNQFCYTQAPFGALIEFVSYPSTQPYTKHTSRRRWTPDRT